MHYTTNGSEQTDEFEIAIYLSDKPATRKAETRQAINTNLDIPPGKDDAQHMATYAFKKPATIYGLFPHMHFRESGCATSSCCPMASGKRFCMFPAMIFNGS